MVCFRHGDCAHRSSRRICIGSVSFAIVVSRLMRLPDPRSYGSKNPGATNVLRTGKKAAAVLTLAGDAGKGWLAVWLAQRYCPRRRRYGRGLRGVPRAPLSGVPPLPGRQGRRDRGRGALRLRLVARSRRARDLDRDRGLPSATRRSLRSIAAAFAPFLCAGFSAWAPTSSCGVAALALLLVWRHRENIARLAAGTESQLGRKKASPPDPSAASR